MAHGGQPGLPHDGRQAWRDSHCYWQHLTSYDADYKVKWDSALHLCKGVADTRPDFQAAILTFAVVGLATTLTLVKVSGCPHKFKQSVYRAEFLATVGALEACQLARLVSDCKGVVACLHALRAGR
eukprot:3475589-Amphidinium_carterae.1